MVISQHGAELFGRTRPHRVAVRVVHLPGDVVDADVVAQSDADWVADETGQEVFAEHLRGQFSAEVLECPRRVHFERAVYPVEEVGDPTCAALGERDLQVGVVLHRP